MSIKYANPQTVTYLPRTEDQDIIVTVVIGNAADESSSFSIYLGRQLKAVDTDAVLGKKAELVGKKTTVVASVIDILDETNWTSLSIFVKEGLLAPVTFGPFAEEVKQDQDTVLYTVFILHQ